MRVADSCIGSLDGGPIKRYLLIMNELTTVEAAAVMALRSLLFCKSQIARLVAFNTLQGTPACDWLLEQGFMTVRTANRTTKFSGDAMPYVTKAGKAWFHSKPGPGVALLVLAGGRS